MTLITDTISDKNSSRHASTNVLAAVPPGTPRAVSHEDITRYEDRRLLSREMKLNLCFIAENRERLLFIKVLRVWASTSSAAKMDR